MARVCIVGAGSSGIVAAKVLHERGIPFDCFEAGSGIGGNWRFMNDNGMSAAYKSLHINTSKTKMAYSDFPMPASFPDFPNHEQILAYFEAYVDAFGFRDTILFRQRVTKIKRQRDNRYLVSSLHREDGEQQDVYDAVLVCNGHHWHPNWVTFPGDFKGAIMHAHAYKTPDIVAGKRVLVVGVGNSGCDIASEATHHADAVFLSTRRGAHVVPKYLLGQPLDTWASPISAALPLWAQRTMMRSLLWMTRGGQKPYGFPTPEHPILSEHPTVSSTLLDHVGHGRIRVKSNVAEYEGEHVTFEDGSTERIDLVILATGYTIAFPFLDTHALGVVDNRVPFYLNVVPPSVPNLYFIGLIQPLGAIMPLAELQSEWVADLLEGKASLPDEATMQRDIQRKEQAMRRRYVASKRHTIQVDFYPYARSLKRARKQGAKQPNQQIVAFTHT